MRKIVASLFMTLDGVVESPNLWAFDFGSPTLVGGLAERGLIDEYRLMVFPMLLGQGRRLFAEGGVKKTLELLEARGFGSGVVLLRYAPAGGQP